MKSKLLTALLSVVVAFGLWLYVISVVSPGFEKTYYNIPVNVQNDSLLTDRGLMITENQNPMVTLHLVGNRVDLNKLNSSNITITVDASRIYESGKHNLSYDITYPGDIADDAISVQSRSTSTISLTVEQRISKPVDVVVEYTGQLPEDFIYDEDNVVLTNEVVNVTGPKSVVDRIAQAKIQVDLNGKTQVISQDFEYTLCNMDGGPVDAQKIETDVENIGVTVKIQRVKEIPLKLEVINGGGATAQNIFMDIQPKTIRISGTDSMLENLNVLVLGKVDLAMLEEATVLKFPIILPDGITNETGITEAKVDIQFPGLTVKRLNISNIVAVNVPEGLEVIMVRQQMEVTLRGPVAMIEALTEADVTAYVDFSDEQQIGTVKLNATIAVNAPYSDVGAVGSYNVSAILRQIVPQGEE